MGDMTAEPSMEDILSSIKRIIAEEGEPSPARPRRQARQAGRGADPMADIARVERGTDPEDADVDPDEVLELNDPMPPAPLPIAGSVTAPVAARPAADLQPEPSYLGRPITAAAEPVAMPTPSAPPAPAQATPPATKPSAAPEPIVSDQAAAATRGSLDALSRMMIKPDLASDGTLEGLVREMLRPMLREWLDANLPGMVETMVMREIAKITGRPE